MEFNRHTELTCTIADLTTYANKVLMENEVLYVVQNDGKRNVIFGDGVTPISGLPYTIDIAAIQGYATSAENSAQAAAGSETAAATSETNAAASAAAAINSISNIPDGSIAPEKLSFLNFSTNLFNKDAIAVGYRLDSNGMPYADATKFLTGFIPVTADITYYSRYSAAGRTCLYDTGKNFVSILATSLSATTGSFTPSVDGYIRTSYALDTEDVVMVCKASEYESVYVPFYYSEDNILISEDNLDARIVSTEKVSKHAITPDLTSFFMPEKNLFDKGAVQTDKFLSGYGVLTTLSGYLTSDYIYVEFGQQYHINDCRTYELYTENKVFLAGANTGSNTTNITVTPTANGFLRVSTALTYLDVLQIEKGDEETEYTPYQLVISELALTEGQKESVLANPGLSEIAIVKSGESFVLRSQFDDSKEIEIQTTRTGSSNGSFNFLGTTVDGVLIHNNTDDITPIRTFTTIGANHGYPLVGLTVAGHDKTVDDLGSIWSDGVTAYTLIKIDGTLLIFGCVYAVDENECVSYTNVNPVATLTHTSGATHTTDIAITAISNPRLCPSMNNISVKYLFDGYELTEDGTYYGKELVIQEEYTVMDYKSILDYAQAHIGESYANGDIAGVVKLVNVFTFTKGLMCTTSHSFQPLKPVTIANCGFLQSTALMSLDGYTRKRFMQGVKVKSGFDFENGVDLDDYATSLVFEPADYTDANSPPSHYIDWLYDGSGNKAYGFSMGYIVDKTNSKHADRVVNTDQGWDMRDTKKSYPVAVNDAVNGGLYGVGDYLYFQGFRNYVSGENVGDSTYVFTAKDKKDVYVYINYHVNGTCLHVKLNDYIGKSISIVESVNFTLLNDVVDAAGVTFSISDGHGYAILKLS